MLKILKLAKQKYEYIAVQKLVLTDNEKCDTEIRRSIGIAKDTHLSTVIET